MTSSSGVHDLESSWNRSGMNKNKNRNKNDNRSSEASQSSQSGEGGAEANKSSHQSSDQVLGFFWRPLAGVLLAILLFVSLLRLHGNLLIYAKHEFGEFFVAQLFSLQLFPVVGLLFLGLIVDVIGARIALFSFFLGAFLFSVLIAFPLSFYSAQLALEIFCFTEILLVLVVFKAAAIYCKGMKFLVFLALSYAVAVIFIHFQPPFAAVSVASKSLQNLGLILTVLSFIFGVIAYFLWPSLTHENRQYVLLKFRDILLPLIDIKGWGAMISVGVFLFYLVFFFKLAVSYYFPVVLDIDDGYEEAVFLFGFGSLVGFFLYAFIFKNTPYPGRVVAASLALAIFCLLGIGFLSMSEELIWCLVALVGVFLGSIILVFQSLLRASGVPGIATALSFALLIFAIGYIFCERIVFEIFHAAGIPEALKHHHYIQLWWFGIFLLAIPMLLMLVLPGVKKSGAIPSGKNVTVLGVLGQYWRGEATLASTFWLLSVLGRWIVFSILFWVIFAFWFPSGLKNIVNIKSSEGVVSPMQMDWYHLSIFGVVLTLFGIVAGIFLLVCVWRAGRRSLWIWRYLSRVVMILSLLRNLLLCFGVSAGLYLHFHPEIMSKYQVKPVAGVPTPHVQS